MPQFAAQHTVEYVAAYIVLFAASWIAGTFLISRVSGWGALASRYRTERDLPQHRRWLQSARMRAGIGYNNILTFGSDAEGLYLRIPWLFAIGHPPLFLPWTEIQAEESKRWLFGMVRTLRLGPDRIPLRLREPLVQFLLEARQTRTAAPTRPDEMGHLRPTQTAKPGWASRASSF